MNRLFDIVFDNPLKIIVLFIFLAVISGIFTIKFMGVNTSTESLIDENLDFKLNQKKLKNEFQVLQNNILIRVKGKKISEVEKITEKILEKIKNKDQEIDFAFSPNLDSFFKKNFFYFLSENQKKQLVNQLYDYQPFLSEINNNPRLKGFNNLLELSLKDEKNLEKFSSVFAKFSESIEKKNKIDWFQIMNSSQSEFFIIAGLNKKYLEENGFHKFYNFLKTFKNFESETIKIEFTGGLIVDYEEINSVIKGASLAGMLSILFVGLILWFAFKNLRIIFSIIITILIGLIITIGLATLFVGTLNLISVAFAVLFIGLSVDFGIQICTRIIEDSKTSNIKKKIKINVKNISNTLLFAAAPSIIGFISFIPTSYVGLSELGIISCMGLIVGLLTNIFFMPSVLFFFPTAFKKHVIKQSFLNYSNLYSRIFSYKKIIFCLFFLVLLLTFSFIERISFDSDPLNLKDEKLSSVKLAKELIEKNPTSDYIISVVVSDVDNINLDEIAKSENISSYYYLNVKEDIWQPDNDLEYLKFLLSVKSKDFYSENDELIRLKKLLTQIIELKKTNLLSESAEDFLMKVNDIEKDNISFNMFQDLLFFNFDSLILFVMELNNLEKSFFESIPDFYKDRYISDSGLIRIEFFPKKNVSEKDNLKNFVDDVSNFFPEATGMPVVQYKAGEVVLSSFFMAFFISFTFLFFFISLVFKDFKLVFSCLFSLFVASVMTLFSMICLNLNFNFANMISLPLLYSLGISYPIYLLKRYQEKKDIMKVIASKTPKAIFYSAFTTIASFGTLAISDHNGTSSMGVLLFVSLLMTLISSLLFLPLIFSTQKKLR